MSNKEAIAALKELMEKYDTYRRLWIEQFGTEDGFNEWFTEQVTKK